MFDNLFHMSNSTVEAMFVSLFIIISTYILTKSMENESKKILIWDEETQTLQRSTLK